MLHSSTYKGFAARPKKDMVKWLQENPQGFNSQVEALVAIQRSENMYMVMKVSYDTLFGYVEKIEPQFYHEWLHGPVKMFFDLDFSDRPNTETEAMNTAHNFLVHLFKRMHKGQFLNAQEFDSAFVPFFNDFIVMRRLRQPDALKGNKLSLHIVRNNGSHYASASALGKYLNTILIPEDRQEFSIDMSVYKDGNFQAILGVKWDEWGGRANPNRDHYIDKFPPVFWPIGYSVDDLDRRTFLSCFVQHIPHGSVLQGSDHVPIVEVTVYNGPSKDLVSTAIDMVIALSPDNSDARINQILYSSVNSVKLSLADVFKCSHGASFYGSIVLNISFIDEACTLSCLCGGKKPVIFLTENARMSAMFLSFSLPKIMEKNLDRVDFPITFDEFGGRALLPSFYERCGFEPDEFCFHPPRNGTGPLYSLHIWRWINGKARLIGLDFIQADLRLAVAYVNLFFNRLQQREQFVYRTSKGYSFCKLDYLKKVEMKKFTYEVEQADGRPNKDGIQRYKIVEKDFIEYWEKDARQRIFSDCKVGVFDLNPELPFSSYDFHDNPPAATNFTECLYLWRSAPPESAIKQMLIRLWRDYLNIVTLLEDELVRDVAKAWIERWFLSILFNYGEKLFTSLWLVSREQGTGKSTMPELFVKALGATLTCTEKNMKAFLNSRFNSEGNVGLVFFDDANTSELGEIEAGAFKNLQTNQIHKSALKNATEKYQVGNQQNFFVAINPSTPVFIPEAGTTTERRCCVMEVPDASIQTRFFSQNPYICGPCRDDGIFGEGKCRHSYSSSADFWCLLKQHVMGVSFAQKGDLFQLFFGMLFEIYLQKKPLWTQTLQITLPVCKAVKTHQRIGRPAAFEFLDRAIKRGYHVCPFGGGQDVFENLQVDWPANIPLLGERATWLTVVPVSAIYKGFKAELDSNLKETRFLSEFNDALKEALGKGFQERMVDCIAYKYKIVMKTVTLATSSGGKIVNDPKLNRKKVPEFHWVAVSKQVKSAKCLVLPDPDTSNAARGLFMMRQPTNFNNSFRMDVASLSQQPVDMRSSSSNSLNVLEPEDTSDPPSQDPRVNTRRLLAMADDAMDIDYHAAALRNGSPEPEPSPDPFSDPENDELEELSHNPYLDVEAFEDDMPESPAKRARVDDEDEVLILSLDSD